MLRVKNQTETTAELYISGSIIDDDEGGQISEWWENTDGYEWPKAIRQQLDEVKGKELTIYINSYGGRVAAGIAIANMIKRHAGKTTAIVDGYCCSIATQVFFAADVCKMPANAYLMIHKPSTAATGDANDMRKTAEALDVLQEGMESTYNARARDGVTPEQIHAMTDGETWLTGKEAAEYFDIELMESTKAVNCYGSKEALASMKCHHIPEAITFKDDSPPIARESLTTVAEPPQAVEDKSVNDLAQKKITIALARAKGMMI